MRHRAHSLHLGLLVLLAACAPTKGSTPPASSKATSKPKAHEGHAKPSKPSHACAPTSIPDTPVGRQATAFLELVATGGAKPIEAFVTDHFTPEFQAIAPMAGHVDVIGGFHDETGGAVVCRVDFASATEAMLLLGPARGKKLFSMTIAVEETAPNRVSSIGIMPASGDALERSPTLDDAARSTIVEGVAAALDDYVFADVAATMQARIRSERDAGHYDGLTHPLPLTRRLTKDLRDVSHDKHLSVQYSPMPLPPEPPAEAKPPEPSPEELARMRAQVAEDGFGIAKVEILAGNIGYIDIRLFHSVDLVREAFSEAMAKLADTKALVIDIRHHHGGDPATVAFVTSYLLGKKKVHLNDLYYRRTDETTKYFTDPAAPGKHYGPKKPIYVLTSRETFSGGEEFAYNLRALERATLVGETTGGGAHPVDGERIDEHIMAIIPVGRAINPITKTNWEGKGVEPHVAVPASEALDEAMALIAAKP